LDGIVDIALTAAGIARNGAAGEAGAALGDTRVAGQARGRVGEATADRVGRVFSTVYRSHRVES